MPMLKLDRRAYVLKDRRNLMRRWMRMDCERGRKRTLSRIGSNLEMKLWWVRGRWGRMELRRVERMTWT